MTFVDTFRGGIAAVVSAAALAFGAGAASAATVQVTIDFETGPGNPASPYKEDGFEIAGTTLQLVGIPNRAILFDTDTPTLTVTRVGGGTFSLISFSYRCQTCDFTVGSTPVTGATPSDSFATFSPSSGFTNISSLVFAIKDFSAQRIDNIVLEYEDPAVIPLPAGLPLLAAGLGALGLMARRRHSAA